MNPIVRWFHQLGSPPVFDHFASRWSRVFYVAALPVLLIGLWQGLFVVPPEQNQGDAFRIIYIHVPSAWMSLLVFALMAFYSAIALIWRIKICEILAMACAPMGAGFTLITLLTGSIWGKGTWGTWWDWDPRMTSELVLLFLYLGVIGLYHAIEDRRSAARAAGLLAIIGVGLLPIIRYSVDWWGALHQRQSISVFGDNAVRDELIAPLWWMVVATKLWFVGSLLAKARADNLLREAGKHWVGERCGAVATTSAGQEPLR